MLRFYICIFSLFCVLTLFSNALPTSLLENTKTLNIHGSKVKRTPDNLYRNGYLEESVADSTYYNKPSAKKRGSTSRQNLDLSLDMPDWNSDSEIYDKHSSQEVPMRKINTELYPRIDEPLDDKHLDDYEKSLNYGTNKDKYENAILKSELYGEPMALSQYRSYYGREDTRRKRNISPYITRFNARLKREIDGNPEDDLLDLISLWEAEHKYNRNPGWKHITFSNAPEYNQMNDDLDDSDDDIDETDENWLETPVYPASRNTGRLSPAAHIINSQSPYYYQTKEQSYPPLYARRPWIGEKTKRFMVSRKRRDPTRELRYFTPSDMNHDRDDNIYTLAQLLSGVQQRDPNVPLYHRAIL